MTQAIIVTTDIQAPLPVVWERWTNPAHVVHWNFASADWHCPAAESDFRNGGSFHYTMSARDGSFSFVLSGTFEEIVDGRSITLRLEDGRQVTTRFETADGKTRVIEAFEPETMNPEDLQRQGWQAILDNFRAYAEDRLRS
ncbi:MAG: activator of HSP90 ATPase [Chitinophagia bacterium]|nr:activator of HSP90 ATPase [Chitinophagia bacterium]